MPKVTLLLKSQHSLDYSETIAVTHFNGHDMPAKGAQCSARKLVRL
jgi:hypothetical protein